MPSLDLSRFDFAIPYRRARTWAGEVSGAAAGCMEWMRRRPASGAWTATLIVGAVVITTETVELHTALLQSHFFSAIAQRLDWTVGPGRSGNIVYPHTGPLDTERGYSRLDEFARRLESRGYRLTEQARFSGTLALLARNGFTPPWREPSTAGLVIRGRDGDTLYDGIAGAEQLGSYEQIPPIVVRTLLFIENRELGNEASPWSNPAVDWGRLAKAFTLYAGCRVGLPLRVEGGSTLAVQLEKFRHSYEGRTSSGLDKLRQIATASLEAYRLGPDTRGVRHEIILDYLNALPLAATPAHGEVRGISDGLREWFGLEPEQVWSALRSSNSPQERARAFRPVLALLCAVRAPSNYLTHDRAALIERMDRFTTLLAGAGMIDPPLARELSQAPLAFTSGREPAARFSFAERKAVDAARVRLQNLLGVDSRYALDHLHLEAQTMLDPALQQAVYATFRRLADPDSVEARGLRGEHLLSQGDPGRVVYTFTLFERTPKGTVLCAYADNLDRPFDANKNMKLELGSTAKLRALAHYLELMAGLHAEMSSLETSDLEARLRDARDPLTWWAAKTILDNPALDTDGFLAMALDREYSASPYEAFFTGGGMQTFRNFDPEDNGRNLTIREASIRSTNLVFVRLMRDIVRYHVARLPYDARAAIGNPDDPVRLRLLQEFAGQETRQVLAEAWRRYRAPEGSERARAVAARYDSLARRHAQNDFSLIDYGWLMRRHPLDVWCATEMARDPTMSFDSLLARSAEQRSEASAWLFKTRHSRAQDVRVRTRIEQDAFERMTPDWKRLGFSFDRLVPSYATAIGSSSDNPMALADLMGIILDGGIRQPASMVGDIRFADGTPYQTSFADTTGAKQVMDPSVARALREVLAQVVEQGTAQRLRGVFVAADGTPIAIGGKTGSGDNRVVRLDRNGFQIDSRPLSRTAAFAFYLGPRHFGVVTAAVLGRASGDYRFTSALPLEIVKQLAPAILQHLAAPEPATAAVAAPATDRRPVTRLAGRF